MASALMMTAATMADPSPLSDEDFLLFLAESSNNEDGSMDPLDMAEQNDEPEKQPEQEDKNED